MWRTCLSALFDKVTDNPSENGTLRHPDIDLALSQRAQKGDKNREGYAAPGLRHAFLPAIVSTSVTDASTGNCFGCSSSLPTKRLRC